MVSLFEQDVLGWLKTISEGENVLMTIIGIGIDFSFKAFIEIYIYIYIYIFRGIYRQKED